MTDLLAETGASVASAFHLIGENLPATGASPEPVEIPAGVSAIEIRNGRAELCDVVDPESAGVFIESVVHESRPRLLLVDQGRRHVCVNDQKVAGVTLLNTRDQIRIDFGPALELAFFHRVIIGEPTPEQVGLECSVCFDLIQESSRILQCPFCPVAIHLEVDGDDPLECALAVSECPGCRQPISMEEGYLAEPEFLK